MENLPKNEIKELSSKFLGNKNLNEKLLIDDDTTSNDQFSSDKINSYLFRRRNFFFKIIKVCKEKLSQSDTKLARGLDWITEELQESILFKSESIPDKYFDELISQNKDLQTIFFWLEEYSTIEFKHKDNTVAKKRLRGSLSRPEDLQKIPLTIVKNYLENETDNEIKLKTSLEEINVIHCSDESIASIESPEFNIFKLESEVGKENTLSTISSYIFASTGLFSKIKYEKFESFINVIAKNYKRDNPYHTDLHAADVLQTCHIFLKYGDVKKRLRFDDLDHSALLISCIIHDYKHPGVTNAFLINTGDPIAIQYNDVSVLENFHVAESFKIIQSSAEYNIFFQLTREEYKLMRKRIIECVLATDMSFHAKQFTYLKLKTEKLGNLKGNNFDKMFENQESLQIYSTQQEFMNVIIHSCDISNPTKPWEIYTQWVDRVMEEFWRQGDREKQYKLPVSFLCDRVTVTKYGAQIGFIEGIIVPYLSVFVEIFPELKFLMENAVSNKNKYKEVKETEENGKNK